MGTVFFLVLQILIIIINVAGNGLVILIFSKSSKFRGNLFNWFITSLATADILISIDMSHSLIRWYYGKWPLGETMCNIFFTVIYTACLMSAFMITVMSLDRYLCVSKPVKYRIFQKASKTRKIVAMGLLATWITVFFVYGVLAFGMDHFYRT